MSFTVEKISHAWRSLTDNQSTDDNNRDRELCQHGDKKSSLFVAKKSTSTSLFFVAGCLQGFCLKIYFRFRVLIARFIPHWRRWKTIIVSGVKCWLSLFQERIGSIYHLKTESGRSVNISINCCGWLNDGFINSLDEIERKLGFSVKGANKLLWSQFFSCWNRTK